MEDLGFASPAESMIVDQIEVGQLDQFPPAQRSTDASDNINRIDSAITPQAKLGDGSTDAATALQVALAEESTDHLKRVLSLISILMIS